MNANIYHKHKDIIITIFIIASRAYLQHQIACNDRIHLFLHSSETCQYNSNVLTLVAGTYYVAGLFDVSEVCWIGLQLYNQHGCLWHLKMKDPMLIVIPLQCNVIAKWAMYWCNKIMLFLVIKLYYDLCFLILHLNCGC